MCIHMYKKKYIHIFDNSLLTIWQLKGMTDKTDSKIFYAFYACNSYDSENFVLYNSANHKL